MKHFYYLHELQKLFVPLKFKRWLVMLSLILLASNTFTFAQISYSQNWETSGLNFWTTSGSGSFSRQTTTPCSGTGVIRANNYYGYSSYLVSPVLTGTNGGDLTVSFNYKVTKYSNNAAGQTLTDLGNIVLQWATSTSGSWTTVYTINSSNHTVSASCATKSATFSGLPFSGNVYIRFVATSGTSSADSYVYFDDVVISQAAPPSCLAPSGLASSSITSSSASLSWTAPTTAPANGYDIYYSTSSTAPSSGTTPTVENHTASPYNATGLTSNTPYYWWIRSDCGASDTSGWASGGSFTTLCNPVTSLPHVEPFATYLPNNCWIEGDAGNLSAGPMTTGNSSIASWNEDGFLNSGSTGAAKINLDYTGDNDWLISTQFTLPASPNQQLKYSVGATEYAATTAPIDAWEADDYVEVLVSTSGTTNWTVLKTYNNTNVPSHLGQVDFVDLTAYANQTIRIAFRGVEGATDGSADIDFFIDNFAIETVPTCIQNSVTTTTSVTASTATLNWTASSSNPSGGYEWEVRTSGVGGSGATGLGSNGTVGAGILTANATSLTATTSYTVWVRANCGGGDYSAWVSGGTFTTPCASSALPFAEGFNSTSLPACWAKQNVAVQTGSNITFETSSTYATALPNEGSHFVKYNSFTSSAGSEERLSSNPINTSGFQDVTVSFDMLNQNASSYNSGNYLNEGVQVQYSINGGSTWTNAGTLFPRVDTSLTSGTTAWKQKTVTLPAAANNQASLLVAFKFHSEYGYNLYIDAVNVTASAISSLDWVSLQWPQSSTIEFDATDVIYAQVYDAGLTDTTSGQAAGIQSWIGLNSSNTDPKTWAESSWKSSTFNMEVGNNDEYKTTVGYNSSSDYVLPGVYYYASRLQKGTEAYLYGGNNLNAGANAGGIWDGATYKSGTLIVLTQVMPDLCGTTFAHPNNRIDAIPVTGATHYKFKFVNGATTTEITSTTSGVAFADLGAALVYGATYQVSVAWSTDSGATYTAFGKICNLTLAAATTKLINNSCGLSTDNPNIRLSAMPLTGATEYTFEFTNTVTNAVTEVVSTTNYTTFGTAGVAFGMYNIKVKAKINGSYIGYGDSCTNSYLPSTSKILASQCGTTVAHSNNLILAEARTGATSWVFKFEEGANTYEITRSTNNVTFAALGANLKYNTNYSISVKYQKNGVWSTYGTACNIAVSQATKVTTGCGNTYVANERIKALPILNATEYTFEFNSGGTTYVTPNPYTTFPEAGIGAGTYSVRVKAKVAGVYGNYDAACDVTYSPTAALANARVMVYPNPFTQGFTIDTSNMKQASITIYDQNAIVKEQHNVTAPNQSLKMGTTLAKGIYFVHVTQNGNTEVYQVIKK